MSKLVPQVIARRTRTKRPASDQRGGSSVASVRTRRICELPGVSEDSVAEADVFLVGGSWGKFSLTPRAVEALAKAV
jgi:hypothetical protein